MEANDWCAYHHREEPIRWRLPGSVVCGECWHFYRSWAHLRWEHVKLARRIYYREPRYMWQSIFRRIYSCPLCTHDF